MKLTQLKGNVPSALYTWLEAQANKKAKASGGDAISIVEQLNDVTRNNAIKAADKGAAYAKVVADNAAKISAICAAGEVDPVTVFADYVAALENPADDESADADSDE